jgi:hypothetical protein
MTKKLIGLYELITGIFGVLLILVNYLTKGREVITSEGVIQQIVLGVILFGFVGYAGYGLLNQKKNALRYSMILQAFQIPFVYTSSIIYKFTAAGFLAIGVKNGSFSFLKSFQPIDFIISSNPGADQLYMIYLVPLILLIALIRIK